MSTNHNNKLGKVIESQVKRIQKAAEERGTVLAQATYISTLGIVVVLPVIVGAYFGRWLDGLMPGYSIQWTLGFIFLGLVIGFVNVYLLIRDTE